jgi:hypothetical protein
LTADELADDCQAARIPMAPTVRTASRRRERAFERGVKLKLAWLQPGLDFALSSEHPIS